MALYWDRSKGRR